MKITEKKYRMENSRESNPKPEKYKIITDPFDNIMEKAGFNGRFQKIYNSVFVFALSFAGAMTYMNIILALNTPDHSCYVPGQNSTNLTTEEWRDLTLPKEPNNRGLDKYSMCKMFDVNLTDVKSWDYEKGNFTKQKITDCKYGYEYDRTWYERTIPSDQDWVCEKDLYVTNTFVVSRTFEVIGLFVLGTLGDTRGRQFVLYISVIISVIFRSMSILVTSSFMWYTVATAIAGLTVNTVIHTPQIVSMEISREDERTTIAMFQNIGWSLGTTVMPLIFWWLRSWVPYMWATTIPTAFILLFYKYNIESPRWLISQKRFAEAIVQFKKIARINKKDFNVTEKELNDMYSSISEEKVYGVASLFTSKRLTKNSIILGFDWSVLAVSYFTLVLFSTQMGGNPFLNFLLQSIVEIPSCVVGKYLADTLGRRISNSASLIISAIICIPIIILAKDEESEFVLACLVAAVKFFTSITFYVVGLQSMEIYPTCLRQTGLALGHILDNAVGVLAPYMVYLGTAHDIRYPYYILGALFVLGGVAALFLPETLHNKLPDTLQEGRTFGRNQKFFSFPKSDKTPEKPKNKGEVEGLNQSKFAP